jgi:hypothetical protein
VISLRHAWGFLSFFRSGASRKPPCRHAAPARAASAARGCSAWSLLGLHETLRRQAQLLKRNQRLRALITAQVLTDQLVTMRAWRHQQRATAAE